MCEVDSACRIACGEERVIVWTDTVALLAAFGLVDVGRRIWRQYGPVPICEVHLASVSISDEVVVFGDILFNDVSLDFRVGLNHQDEFVSNEEGGVDLCTSGDVGVGSPVNAPCLVGVRSEGPSGQCLTRVDDLFWDGISCVVVPIQLYCLIGLIVKGDCDVVPKSDRCVCWIGLG